MRRPQPEREQRRIAVMRALFVIGFALLGARAAQLGIADERRQHLRDGQVQTEMQLAPERGAIVDRRGGELAVSVRAPSVYVLPDALVDPGRDLAALGRLLDRPAATLRERIGQRRRFTFVERWIDPARGRAIEELDKPGIGVLWEPRRAYPGGSLAAAVLGFTNVDGLGVRGIEQQENDWLSGSAQSIRVERDGGGRLLAVAGVNPLASAGGDVALTIDARLQAEAEHALAESVRETRARGGSVVTLDPTTGEILALAEAPGFDPNGFRDVDFARTRLRSFSDAVEPGSTLKVFLVAAGLEAGAISDDEDIDCSEGEIALPGKTIRDRKDFGVLDPAGVLRVSSNVGAVRIAQSLGPALHHAALLRFGFGSRTGSGFPGESSGLLRPPESWRPVDQATLAFGQGLSVTVVQLASATAALANGGTWMRPHLVAARRRAAGRWQMSEPEAVRRVVSTQTASKVLSMMEQVVSPTGTGRRAALDGVRVAGKTGTAQKLDPQTGRYSRDRYIAWFIGAVPADDPRLAIVVALDEPAGSNHSGGAVAAPLFGRVAAAQLTALGYPTHWAPLPHAAVKVVAAPPPSPPAARNNGEARRVETRTAAPATDAPAGRHGPDAPGAPDALEDIEDGDSRALADVAAPPDASAVEVVRHEDRILLPDFRGLSVSEVMRITSEHDLELQVRGRGRAVEQDPGPGTILPASAARVRVRFADDRPAGEG